MPAASHLRSLLLFGCLALAWFAPGRARAEEPAEAPRAERRGGGRASLPAEELDPLELRALPEDPCERLTLVISALDRRQARASCLAGVRLAGLQDRVDEGVILLGLGILGVVAGAVATGTGLNDHDEAMLTVGLGVLGFGAVDLLVALPLFDFDGAERTAIEDDTLLGDEALLAARDRAARAEDDAATAHGLRAALDLLVITAGALLYGLGSEAQPDEPWIAALGLTAMVEGGVLLAFDGTTWVFASERAARLRAALND